MELFDTVKNICEGAKVASRSLALLSGEKRNALLIKIADKYP